MSVPYALVVGPREVASREVSVNCAGVSEQVAFDAALARVIAAAHADEEAS
jgi:hypothetical protein